jgi:tight adherence protein C
MTVQQMLYLLLLFVAVTSGVIGIGFVLSRGSDLKSRLRGAGAGAGVGVVARENMRQARGFAFRESLMALVSPVGKLATPSDDELTEVRLKFVQAGLRHKAAPTFYFAIKAILFVFFPLVLLVMQRAGLVEMAGNLLIGALVLAAATGFYLPSWVLGKIRQRRQREIFEAFPDSVDLVIVCVEAGLGLDAAIKRVATELRLRSPALCDEFELILVDLSMGSPRDRAMRNFSDRTGVEEVSTFVGTLLQADKFGVSVVEALRVHAEMVRSRRMVRAEEAAAKISVKLLFPLIFFIFPSLMLVLMGPAVIQIFRVMLPAMSGR